MDALRQEALFAAASQTRPDPDVTADVRVWLRGVSDRALAIVARDEHDDRDVHQMRLTTKRLRALWQMLRPAVAVEHVVFENRQLAGAARVMAADRDAFVLREMIESLRQLARKKKDLRAIDLVLEHLPPPQGAELSPIRAYAEFLRQRVHLSLSAAQEAMASVADGAVLVEGVAQTYGRAQRLGLKAYFKNTPRSFHRWRKWVKYLYYQIEILDPPGDEWKATSEALDRLGKILGACHDMTNVQALLAGGSLPIEEPRVLERVADLARRHEHELVASSRPLAAQLFAEHSRSFAQRLTAATS